MHSPCRWVNYNRALCEGASFCYSGHVMMSSVLQTPCQLKFILAEALDLQVFDSSWICGIGEFVSYVKLQKRAMQLRHVLLGYYELPGRSDNPLQLVVNPQSAAARLEERLWNIGGLPCFHVQVAVLRGVMQPMCYCESHHTLLSWADKFAHSGIGHVKFLALSPMSEVPKDPLITKIKSEDIPLVSYDVEVPEK